MAKNDSKDAGDLGKQRPQLTSSVPARKPASTAAAGNSGETAGRRASGPTELPAQFGRYRVKKKLGGGGMGTVYLVENIELEREEALKVPHFADGDDPQLRERFLREARSAAKLDHANLCPIYDVGVQDGVYYLTMRFLKGKLLSDYTGQAQPARKAVEIVTKLAQALEAAHGKGVIHRDLKPSNVMMVAGVGPVVMDFGLAKQVRQEDQKLTKAGSMLGTPAYMPPEQVNGDLERMGPASDVYSLGVILYELLTGRLPFEGTMAAIFGQILYTEPPLPSALLPGLGPALDGICSKAMAKASTERYPSMKVFAAALMDFLRATLATAGAGNPAPTAGDKGAIFQAPTVAPGPLAAATVTPRAVKATPVAKKRSRRSRPAATPSMNRWLAAGAGVALVLLGIIGLWTMVSFLQHKRPATQAKEEASNAITALPERQYPQRELPQGQNGQQRKLRQARGGPDPRAGRSAASNREVAPAVPGAEDGAAVQRALQLRNPADALRREMGTKHPEEEGLKSLKADVATTITFINRSGKPIKVYWIDYMGARKFYQTLQDGQSYGQRTFLSHPWVITDEHDNAWYVYLPETQPKTIEIVAP